MAVRHSAGFTLIESIVAIVLMAFAMLSLTSFLFPQVQQSARPHYEVRAVALAQSLMQEVLAKGFDQNSDPDGGALRCGEHDVDGEIINCSAEAAFGPDSTDKVDGVADPGLFNDVDDYIGCWISNSASRSHCSQTEAGSLTDIFGNSVAADYPDFAVDISVVYDNDGFTAGSMKRITIRVTAGLYGDFIFTGYRGNY